MFSDTAKSDPPRNLSSFTPNTQPLTSHRAPGRIYRSAEGWFPIQETSIETHVQPRDTQTAHGDESQMKEVMSEKNQPARVVEHEVTPMEYLTQLPKRGVDWRSPASMLLAFFIGLVAAIGQHAFYSSLAGQLVGDTDHQQQMLRYGTAFAFATQVGLVASVSIAATQCLWRSLRRSNLPLSVIDAAFDSHTTVVSFFNIQLLWKLKVASLLVLVAWCLPIASLVTPATLSVNLILKDHSLMAGVPSLNISDPNQAHRYAYATASKDTANPRLVTYLRPRTILTRLAEAAGTTGEILQIPPVFVNATYELQFFGPVVKCNDANGSVATQIGAAVERRKSLKDNSTKEIQNSYFAMVPDLSVSGINTHSGVIQVANHSDTNSAAHGSNQLWLGFSRNQMSLDGQVQALPHYLQCSLYNTSYNVEFSFVQGGQSLKLKNELKPLNPINYPSGPSESDEAQMEMAYTAFMWTLSDQLTGSIAFYSNMSTTSQSEVWSEITSNIQNTALLGSSDLQSFFDFNTNLFASKQGTKKGKVSDQRAEDIALAQNRTLDVLIEELSSNITLSLMSSDLLSPSVPANVTTTRPINVYAYHPRNLFIAYSIAIFFSLMAVILGTFAYISNGVSHNNSFSSIVRATRNPELSRLNERTVWASGFLPMNRQTRQPTLRLRDDGFVVCHK